MAGYKSDIIFFPDSGIGAVILTNSDNGGMMLRPFMRRLLEIAFDGKPEAVADVAAAAARHKAYLAKERERLGAPADALLVKQLATRYTSKEVGGMAGVKKDGAAPSDFGEVQSRCAARTNRSGPL